MAHEIETMAFFQQTPWHGLGTALDEDDLYDWRKTCEKAGLAWDVELVPLVTADAQAQVRHKAVRRTTDGRTLGVVGPRFCVLQNRDAFAWFQPFLDAREAALHTAGSLRNGSRIWVLAKLNRAPLVVAPGDEVEKFILLSHGHDGSLAVRVGFTPVRVVCQNTLSMAHGSDASRLIRVKHTRDVHQNLDERPGSDGPGERRVRGDRRAVPPPGPQERQPGRPAPLRQEGLQGGKTIRRAALA